LKARGGSGGQAPFGAGGPFPGREIPSGPLTPSGQPTRPAGRTAHGDKAPPGGKAGDGAPGSRRGARRGPRAETPEKRGAGINGKRKEPDIKRVNVNEMIRAPQVRVIGEGGVPIGILTPRDALAMARQADLDLVEVAPEADPPVCRIMDFGRYKYLLSKKQAESRRKATIVEIKEVKFRPKTADHDYQTKLKMIVKFLTEKNKVKVSLTFRGREITHANLGHELMQRVIRDVAELGTPEQIPKLEGRSFVMIIGPKA
jgi:translation initiation factor IF-3